MQQVIKKAILFFCLLYMIVCTGVFAEDTIQLVVNGVTLQPDSPPVIVEDRTLVPARSVFEAMTAQVAWDGDSRTVTITYEEQVITLAIDSATALVDGKKKELDVPAQIIKDRTMIPVRFVSEALGFSVDWDQETRTVSITTPTVTGVDITNIAVTHDGGRDVITLQATGFCEPTVMRLEDPARLVFDFKGASITDKVPETDSDLFEKLRTGLHPEGQYGRLAMDVAENVRYIVKQSGKSITIILYESENAVDYNNGKLLFADATLSKTKKGNVFTASVLFEEETISIGDAFCSSVTLEEDEITVECSGTAVLSKNVITFEKPEVTPSPSPAPTPSTSPAPSASARPVNKNLIVIDAGHGGAEIGSDNKPAEGEEKVYEKKINLEIALKVQKGLEEKGFEVLMTRDGDYDVGLMERSRIANATDAGLFVSIHCNAFNKKANGTEVWYFDGNETGRQIAKLITDEICASLGTVNRGPKPTTGLSVIRYTDTLSVLVECGFIDNPDEFLLLSGEETQQQFADAIVSGIEQAIELL